MMISHMQRYMLLAVFVIFGHQKIVDNGAFSHLRYRSACLLIRLPMIGLKFVSKRCNCGFRVILILLRRKK